MRVAKTQEELNELDDENTDIFKSNIIQRYSIRPTSIAVVENLCLAEFAAYYYKDYKMDCSERKDSQPDVLTDDLIESQSTITDTCTTQCLSKKLKFRNTNECMKCRKVEKLKLF